jgi:predicted transcriptional regulator
VHRIVESLLGDGSLEHRGDGYALTGRGRRLRETYATLRDTAAQAIDKRAFFRWLPGELDEFPITAVDDATLIRNHPDQPHNVLGTYVRAADPALNRFRGMSAVLSPALTQAYQPMMDGGTDLRAVCSEDLLFAFHRDPEFIDCVRESGYAAFLRDGFVSGRSKILFVPESFPLQVGIYDDHRIIISPTPATGVSEEELAAIDSMDPAVVSWVQAYFESYYDRGRTPLAVFLSRLD